jgi:hypothetical protein
LLALSLALGACEGIFVRGNASEHGPDHVRVGIPL